MGGERGERKQRKKEGPGEMCITRRVIVEERFRKL